MHSCVCFVVIPQAATVLLLCLLRHSPDPSQMQCWVSSTVRQCWRDPELKFKPHVSTKWESGPSDERERERGKHLRKREWNSGEGWQFVYVNANQVNVHPFDFSSTNALSQCGRKNCTALQHLCTCLCLFPSSLLPSLSIPFFYKLFPLLSPFHWQS